MALSAMSEASTDCSTGGSGLSLDGLPRKTNSPKPTARTTTPTGTIQRQFTIGLGFRPGTMCSRTSSLSTNWCFSAAATCSGIIP